MRRRILLGDGGYGMPVYYHVNNNNNPIYLCSLKWSRFGESAQIEFPVTSEYTGLIVMFTRKDWNYKCQETSGKYYVLYWNNNSVLELPCNRASVDKGTRYATPYHFFTVMDTSGMAPITLEDYYNNCELHCYFSK